MTNDNENDFRQLFRETIVKSLDDHRQAISKVEDRLEVRTSELYAHIKESIDDALEDMRQMCAAKSTECDKHFAEVRRLRDEKIAADAVAAEKAAHPAPVVEPKRKLSALTWGSFAVSERALWLIILLSAIVIGSGLAPKFMALFQGRP